MLLLTRRFATSIVASLSICDEYYCYLVAPLLVCCSSLRYSCVARRIIKKTALRSSLVAQRAVNVLLVANLPTTDTNFQH